MRYRLKQFFVNKVLIFSVLFLPFGSVVKAQVQDIFRYKPVYEIAHTNSDKYDLQFLAYSSNSQLKDLLDGNTFNHPLYTLNSYLSASSNEERHSFLVDATESRREAEEGIRRSALLYQTDSVEVVVASQLTVSFNGESYSYIKYAVHFKYASLVEGSAQREFSALKIAIKKNGRWLLTNESPLGGRFKLAFYNCPTEKIGDLLRGEILVNGYSVVSDDNTLDLERLIQGMDSAVRSENGSRSNRDTINLSYIKEEVELEEVAGQFWIDQKGSHPVDPNLSAHIYDEEQLKLFLAVHRAIIMYTSNVSDVSITVEEDELNLAADMVSKTHLIKYGVWDRHENLYVFKVERNGPYEIKRFIVSVTEVDGGFTLEVNKLKHPFEYVKFISGRLHSTFLSPKFSREESNRNIAELKSSCMNRVGSNTVIDFECFSAMINQLSQQEQEAIINTTR